MDMNITYIFQSKDHEFRGFIVNHLDYDTYEYHNFWLDFGDGEYEDVNKIHTWLEEEELLSKAVVLTQQNSETHITSLQILFHKSEQEAVDKFMQRIIKEGVFVSYAELAKVKN